MSDSEIKKMSIEEFVEAGFLQEVNRLVLHPCGLALEVTLDEDPAKSRISGVWDYRDDPEGIWFDWKSWPKGSEHALEKAKSVREEKARHEEARTKLFAERYPVSSPSMSDTTIEPVIYQLGIDDDSSRT